MRDLEKEIMENVAKLLKTKEGVSNVEVYINLEYSWVVKYQYEGRKYLISMDELYI